MDGELVLALFSIEDPARTRALNSLLMEVKFSLEAVSLYVDKEEDRWWLLVSQRLLAAGGGGSGVRAWISLISSSSSLS